MEIMEYIDLFLGALLNFLFFILIIRKIFNCQTVKNKIKLFLICLIISIFITLVNVFNKNIFKIVLIFPLSVIGIKIIFNISFRQSIIYTIISNLYMFIGEILVGIVFSLLPVDSNYIFNNVLGTIIGSIFVIVFTIQFIYISKLSRLSNNIAYNINGKEQVLYAIIIIAVLGAISYKNGINVEDVIELLSNSIIVVSFIIVLYMCYIENIKLQEISKNYNEMLKYLEKYEKELVEKRKIIHDYKNQLIIINSYIGNEQKLTEYIKELMIEQKEIKENPIIRNIDKLPCGLKGLVYYKFSQISDDIVVDMRIKNNLTKIDKLSPKISKNLLKIVGVLLDNALEAARVEKEKYIDLEFSLSKGIFKLIIKNYCSKNLNYKNFFKTGYSTKGINRGYGLSLVRDILIEEKLLSLDIKIENNEFIAELKTKLQ